MKRVENVNLAEYNHYHISRPPPQENGVRNRNDITKMSKLIRDILRHRQRNENSLPPWIKWKEFGSKFPDYRLKKNQQKTKQTKKQQQNNKKAKTKQNKKNNNLKQNNNNKKQTNKLTNKQNTPQTKNRTKSKSKCPTPKKK